MKTLTIKKTNEETVEFLIDGKLIGSTNHDQIGWSGMEVVENFVRAIAESNGMEIEEEEVWEEDE